jgi:hypothetical protein
MRQKRNSAFSILELPVEKNKPSFPETKRNWSLLRYLSTSIKKKIAEAVNIFGIRVNA